MTDNGQSFGSAVTPPHRPQPLTTSVDGEEIGPVYGEGVPPSFGEGPLRAHGESLGPLPIEGEAPHRPLTQTSGGRTSAFIVGEDREERYRCDICGKEFDSGEELERHVKRVGIVE